MVQSLILFEKIFADKIKSNATFSPDLNKVLEILDFVYFLRDKYLGDPDYVYINKQNYLTKIFCLKPLSLLKKILKSQLFKILMKFLILHLILVR